MRRTVVGAAAMGALLAALPAVPARAQQTNRFVLMGDSAAPPPEDRALRPLRANPFELREDAFGQPYDMFGIPLTGERTTARERGFSFSVRPQKGIRAVARLRF